MEGRAEARRADMGGGDGWDPWDGGDGGEMGEAEKMIYFGGGVGIVGPCT